MRKPLMAWNKAKTRKTKKIKRMASSPSRMTRKRKRKKKRRKPPSRVTRKIRIKKATNNRGRRLISPKTKPKDYYRD